MDAHTGAEWSGTCPAWCAATAAPRHVLPRFRTILTPSLSRRERMVVYINPVPAPPGFRHVIRYRFLADLAVVLTL